MGATLGVWLVVIGAAMLFGWACSMCVQALARWLGKRDPLSIRERLAEYPEYEPPGGE